MAEITITGQLAHLEALGDAANYASQMNALIQRSPLFENFNLAEIRLLSHFMTAYQAAQGVEVIGEGQSGDFMMLLLDGSIEVFRRDRWNAQRLIAVLQPGQTVGEMSMIDGDNRFASCIATEPTDFAVLTRPGLNEIFIDHPRLGNKLLLLLLQLMTRRLRDASSRLLPYIASIAV